METATRNETGDSTPYDSIPYPSYVFPQTGPDRLATLAALHGLDPAAPSGCRYLELGCGDGTNVAAFASAFPGSTFVGIDLAANHIDRARETSRRLGLANAEFHAADILSVPLENLGRFDYIVAHGLFSWVPDAVRLRVLETMRSCLAPSGIGYVSYNALPGCRIRSIGWDLARLRTRNIDGLHEKVAGAIDIAAFMAEASPQETFHKRIYASLADGFRERDPENVLHDDLCDINEPFYFLEFAEMLGRNDLKFICEANPASIGDGRLSPDARAELDRIAASPLEREQYLDFIDFASFRQSLICHSASETSASPDPESIFPLYAQAELSPSTDYTAALVNREAVTFASASMSLETDHPLTKAVLHAIGGSSPVAVRIADAVDASERMLSNSGTAVTTADKEGLSQFLLKLYTGGVLRLFTEALPVAESIGDRPSVSPFARWQALSGLACFTTPLGENIVFGNDLVRAVVGMLDGTRDRDDLANDLLPMLSISAEQVDEARRQLPSVIESNIVELHRLGAFVG